MEETVTQPKTRTRKKASTTGLEVLPTVYQRKESKLGHLGNKTVDVAVNTLDMIDQTQLAYIDTMKLVRDMLATQRVTERLDLVDDMKARGMDDVAIATIINKYCTPGA